MRNTIVAGLIGGVLLAPLLSEAQGQVRKRRPLPKRPLRNPQAKTRRPKSPADLQRLHIERYRRQQAEERKRHNREIARWSAKVKTSVPADQRDEALFRLADAYARAGRIETAAGTLKELAVGDRDPLWSGEARLRLLDVVLFDECNLAEADKLAKSGLQWAESRAAPKTDQKRKPQSPPKQQRKTSGKATGTEAASDGLPRTAAQVAAEFCRRQGLLRYLRDDVKGAYESFQRAYRFGLKPHRSPDLSQVSIERARFAVLSYRRAGNGISKNSNPGTKSGKKVVAPAAPQLSNPEPDRQGNPQASALLRFANLLQAARDFRRCGKCCERVLELAAAKGTPGNSPKRVHAGQIGYAHYLHGRSLYASRNPALRAKAKTDYLTAQKRSPQAPWAGDALFLAANVTFNHERRRDQAISLWQRVVREYPKSRNAPRAAYFIGIAYELDKKYAEAEAAFEAALKAYPKDRFAKLVEEHLLKVKRKLDSSR